MEPIRIRLRNYRAFTDQMAAEFVIYDGFTAFVGPNNSGKSSLLRLLFELRPVWSHLTNLNGIIPLLRSETTPSFSVSLPALEDPSEIFCNQNPRDIELDIEILMSGGISQTFPHLTRLALTASRPRQNQEVTWNVRFCWPDDRRPSHPLDNVVDDHWTTSSGQKVIDLGPVLRSMRTLSSTFYIGPFRNVLTAEHDKYYDIALGSSFVSKWNDWKNGPIKEHNKRAVDVLRTLKNLFGFSDLDISPTHDKRSLHVHANSEPYKLRELGGGFSQFIVTLGNAAFANPDLILIDEPELGLHPSLQLDFLTALSSYSRKGTLFATHSIGLARSSAEHVYAVQGSARGSSITAYSGITNLAEFAGAMSFSSYPPLGFDTILLVEGVTEIKTMQQWLRLFELDHRVVMIPMGGDQLAHGGVSHELSELKRITPNVFALVDSERTMPDGAPKKVRLDFERTCKELGIEVALTERRATENYLTDEAVKAEKGPQYQALPPFETIRDQRRAWSKTENWRIARHMKRADIENTDIGQFLARLAKPRSS